MQYGNLQYVLQYAVLYYSNWNVAYLATNSDYIQEVIQEK